MHGDVGSEVEVGALTAELTGCLDVDPDEEVAGGAGAGEGDVA